MMHLMVNCRHMLAKKTTSPGYETLNDGLATFALDHEELELCKPQQILGSPPRQSCQCQKPDVFPTPRNYGEDFEYAAHSVTTGCDGSDRSVRKKSLGGMKGHRRSAPLDGLQVDTICLGPTLTASLAFKEPRNTSPVRAKLTADDSTGKFAYISLDGRLVNADLATTVTAIGGKLGDEEARPWEEFVPMQLVLFVAVAAAVTAASKQRKLNEIDRLLKTVENRVLCNREHCTSRILAAIASFVNIIMSSLHTFLWALITTLGISSLSRPRWTLMIGRLKLLPYMACTQEKELISLSQELNEACKLNNANASHLHGDRLDLLSCSPKTPPTQKKLGLDLNGDKLVGNLNLREGWSSTKYVSQTVVASSLDLFSIATSPARDEVNAREESKWYVNPMVEASLDSDDSFTTPERCISVFPACHSASQGSFERTASRSSFDEGETNVSSGLPPSGRSPPEFDSYLVNGAQSTSGCNDISKIEENIAAWRQYLERNHVAETVFEGDVGKSPNKLKLGDEEDVTDLANQLQSKEAEIAELKKGRQVLLEANNREIEELKAVLKSRDAELEKLLADAETTRTANVDLVIFAKRNWEKVSDNDFKQWICDLQRIALLEEICKDKESTICDLKQDIQSLEWKVQKSRLYQSPTGLRGRRYSLSSIPASNSDHGTSQKQRLADKYDPSSDPGSIHALEHTRRSKKGVPSNSGRMSPVKAQTLVDIDDDGGSEHGYDRETSQDYSFLLGSGTGDDFSINSLACSETDVDRRFGREDCDSLDGSRSNSFKDQFSGMRGSMNNRTLQKHKSMSSDLRRDTSFVSSSRSFTRTQSSRTHTFAEESAGKSLHRNLSVEMKKVSKNPISPVSSPQTGNFKGLGLVVLNHFRSSSVDTNFKSNNSPAYETSGGLGHNGSSHNHKNSATKRKQWV